LPGPSRRGNDPDGAIEARAGRPSMLQAQRRRSARARCWTARRRGSPLARWHAAACRDAWFRSLSG
jgi:hypothetical protein